MSLQEQEAYLPLQKWEEAYRKLLDEIYNYPGYWKKLLEEDPNQYQKEYEAFIALYDGPY